MANSPPRIGLYAGSFDPLTLGHEDIARRGARLFDKLVIGVGMNPEKQPLFSPQERADLMREVFSDEPRNVWLAIGSDDQSKLWVNGVLVWRSIDLEKPWQPDEGYRKIRLKRGANRFLFRLENGIQRAAMSVMLRAAD